MPIAKLAALLRQQGFDFHVFEERPHKVLVVLRKHKHSPPTMELAGVIEYLDYSEAAAEGAGGSAVAAAGSHQQSDRPVYRLKPPMDS